MKSAFGDHLIVYCVLFTIFGYTCLGVEGQKQQIAQRKNTNTELVDSGGVPVAMYGDEVMNKVESQLLNVIELLQAYQEAAPMPIKIAEKRRNKFEFIRFGRRRR